MSPPIISHNSYDYLPNQVLPVIASFDTDGNMKPLYFRLYGQSHHVISYMVRARYANTIDFNCKFCLDDKEHFILLTYHRLENVWTIPSDDIA